VPEDDRLVTPQEAARALGISTATLARWARRGLVTPAEILPNGDRRWSIRDLRRQLAELRQRERNE
jgi:DNA-binding transcriptional MerR regulator